MKKRIILLVLGVLLAGSIFNTSTPAQGATVYTKDNGVIKIKLNEDNWPMITHLYINNAEIVPNYGVGADMQITTRSFNGNRYNPTQGGNCRGVPSNLSGVIPNWNGSGLGVSSTYGILLGVDPRSYDVTDPYCDPNQAPNYDVGPILPYNFNFGVTLGDGVNIPKQAMVLDVAVQRESGSQEILKIASELPVAYVKSATMRYAYYSPDNISYYPVLYNGTNDTLSWPSYVNVNVTGKVVMLSSQSNAVGDPLSGVGMAFYSNFTMNGGLSHRAEPTMHLTAMWLVGSNDGTHIIPTTDFNWYSLRRVVAVGNLGTIRTAIDQVRVKAGSNWGNWTP
jgi:hypothetical protein